MNPTNPARIRLVRKAWGDEMIDITSDGQLRALLEASTKQPLVIDFWAPWCGPCHCVAAILGEVENLFPGSVFARLNVENLTAIAARFEVHSLPTVLVVRDGKVTDQITGFIDRDSVVFRLQKSLI